MAEYVTLNAQPRTILGKKVRRLRREGVMPANVYGRGIESTAIQLDMRDFLRIARHEGIRSMFELKIEGEGKPRMVLVRKLERYGGTGDPIHADFYQVQMDQEMSTRVPVILVGEAPAVTDLRGTLIDNVDTIPVRCLPGDLPDAFEVDLSSLATFEDTITVADLKVPAGVTVELDPDVMIATVSAPRLAEAGEEEEELEAAPEAGEPTADVEAAGGEGAEGGDEAAEATEG